MRQWLWCDLITIIRESEVDNELLKKAITGGIGIFLT